MVGTATSTAATGLTGGRLSQKRSQREGEGSDACAEQGVWPTQDDTAVGAGRHQTVQVGHA